MEHNNIRNIYAWTDIFVRYLLGDERNIDLLLSFLNAVNEDYDFPPIREIQIKNPFNMKDLAKEKESVIDVKAKDSTGRLFDIEIQAAGDSTFIHRSLYYWARLYSGQLEQGNKYIRLKPTICINLLNFKVFPRKDSFHSCFIPREYRNPDFVLTDHFVIHYLELEKFFKEKDFGNSLEKWLAYFKYEGRREDIMQYLIKDNEPLQKAHERFTQFTKSDELIEIYEARMKQKADYETGMEIARNEGIEQGRIDSARRLKRKGFSNKEISEMLDIPPADIEDLEKE